VGIVLVAIVIVPSAPVLVPELAGAAAAEIADLRKAVLTASAALPDRWVAIGAAAVDAVWPPASAGTFAGFGVDVAVGLSPHADHVQELALCALITGWIRGQVRPDARAEVRSFTDADDALAQGGALRTAIDADPEPIGVLVVADGCNTLTPAAPGGHDPDSVAVQAGLDDALAAGDTAGLATLPATVGGRAAFAVLAGLAGPATRAATELYRGAPFGVGYTVAVWQP
jgi:hypothetical protein